MEFRTTEQWSVSEEAKKGVERPPRRDENFPKFMVWQHESIKFYFKAHIGEMMDRYSS